MDLEQLYQQVILDHYRSPHGKGLRDPFDAEVHHVNPTCGDEITLRLLLGVDDAQRVDLPALADDAGRVGQAQRVADVSYDAQGCSISQASASVMFDQIEGQALTRAIEIGDDFAALMRSATEDVVVDEDALGDGVAFSGVARYPARIKCALLPWMAFRDAAVRAAAAGDQHGQQHDPQSGPQSDSASSDPIPEAGDEH